MYIITYIYICVCTWEIPQEDLDYEPLTIPGMYLQYSIPIPNGSNGMRLLRWRGRLGLLLSAVGPGATLPLATVGEKIWGFHGIVGLTNQRKRGVNHQKWGYHPITLGNIHGRHEGSLCNRQDHICCNSGAGAIARSRL